MHLVIHQGFGLVYTDSLSISYNITHVTLADGLKNGRGYSCLSGMSDHLNDKLLGDGKEFFFWPVGGGKTELNGGGLGLS